VLACLGNSFRFQGRLHHGMHEAIVQRRIVVVFLASHSPPFNQWATFLPVKQGLHFDINPAVLAPHKLSLHLVTYPPHAVTSPSLTNLGPVARLDVCFRFSPETIILFCMLIVFSIQHHLTPIRHHRFTSSTND